VNDIIAGSGPRIPNSTNARHDFRRATIVVSRDALLTADEMDFYTYFARRGEERAQVLSASGLAAAKMTNPFYLATGKRGTMRTSLALTGWPVLPPGSVVNGASYGPAIGRGSFVSIFGTGFISTGSVTTPTAALPLTLANSVVYVNGVQAPLYYVSPDQVNFQLPFDTPLGKASVTLVTPLGATNAAWIDVTAAAPGILIYGSNRAVAQNQDYSLNGPSNGAAPGSYVTVYLTGIGPLDTPVATGAPAPFQPLARATSNARATLGSTEVPIVYLGLTPGYAGLAQLNLQIPANLAPGDYLLTLTIGSAVSNQVLIRVG
jgi:uncharacterized protein (TIGR03437 family)